MENQVARITQEEIKESIEKTLSLMRMMLEDNTYHPAGIVYRDSQDKPDTIEVDVFAFDPSLFGNSHAKNMILAVLLKELMNERSRMFTIASDTWTPTKALTDAEREKLPDSMGDWPKDMVKDCLVCWGNACGHDGVVGFQSYRKEGDKFVFDEVTWDAPLKEVPGMQFKSRFSVDLRQQTPEEAMYALMTRGSAMRKDNDGEMTGPTIYRPMGNA